MDDRAATDFDAPQAFERHHACSARLPARSNAIMSLPRLHGVLTERGFYEEHPHAVARSYRQVFRECIGERADRPDLDDVGRGRASLANMA